MVLPPLWRNAAAISTVAAAAVFGIIMDANPKLWLLDLVVVSDRRLQQHFRDKRIWITGASSGIGAALATQLSKSGASLILSARNEVKLRQVADTCQQSSNDVTILPLDVTSPSQVDAALEEYGPEVDILILNAGIGHLQPALETTMEETEKLFRVNTLAPISMATKWLQQEAQRQQKQKRRRHLVVTSSVASLFGVPLSASYAASKHAVHGYFKSLQSELAASPAWLRIDLPCPGSIATDFHIHKKYGINGAKSDMDTSTTSKELKMPVERCARLILSSMIIPGNGGETWIAQQPTLLFCFINQYMPSVANWMLQKMGPTRLAMWQAGLNLYDPSSLRKLKNECKKKEDQKVDKAMPR